MVGFILISECHYCSGHKQISTYRQNQNRCPLSLGPGVEISEIPPSDYLPFLKKWLPKGYKSDPDRIVAFPTTGISMKPTIMPGSIVWVDRMDTQPREGEIYAFWLERTNAITIKRLIKISRG